MFFLNASISQTSTLNISSLVHKVVTRTEPCFPSTKFVLAKIPGVGQLAKGMMFADFRHMVPKSKRQNP